MGPAAAREPERKHPGLQGKALSCLVWLFLPGHLWARVSGLNPQISRGLRWDPGRPQLTLPFCFPS